MTATRDYIVRMPKDFTVVEACEQAGCENWRYGWEVILDERDPFKRDLAARIRRGEYRRTYRELPGGGDVTVFRFEPHQRCFEEHRTRPASWLVRSGTVRRHAGMRDWIDDLDEHVGQLEDQARRG